MNGKADLFPDISDGNMKSERGISGFHKELVFRFRFSLQCSASCSVVGMTAVASMS